MNAEAANDPTRERRTSSEGPFPVRIRLLGGFSVWVGSRAVGEGAWHLRKARSLVKLLALAPGHRPHGSRLGARCGFPLPGFRRGAHRAVPAGGALGGRGDLRGGRERGPA